MPGLLLWEEPTAPREGAVRAARHSSPTSILQLTRKMRLKCRGSLIGLGSSFGRPIGVAAAATAALKTNPWWQVQAGE